MSTRSKKTLLTILSYMIKDGKIRSFDEVLLKHRSELEKYKKFNYEALREYASNIEECAQKLVQMCEMAGVAPHVICETVLCF